MNSAADEAWRRRTWHPDTRGNFQANASSNLSNVITPTQFQPSPTPLSVHNAGPQPTVRLPGIESFDPLPPRPVSPPRRNPSPMMIDSDAQGPPALLPSADSMDDRRSTAHWDMGLHRGLTRLDLTSNSTPPRDSAGAWASEVNQAVQAQAEQVRLNPPTVRFEGEPSPSFANAHAGIAARAHHQHTMSAPSIAATTREAKRHGWYHGPVMVTNVQGQVEQPSADPRAAYVSRMDHPNMNGFTGFPTKEPQPAGHAQQPPTNNQNPLRGLEALVAVATSEGSTATAY
jgi:C2H2 transcription facotor